MGFRRRIMNASVSVKFTPSTKQFGKGRIYFQIIRKRVVRQFNPDIRLPNDMWISDNTFPCTKDEEVNERIKQLIKQIRKCIEVLEVDPNYSADDVIRAINDDRNNLVNYINLLSERLSMSGKKKTSENYKGLARRIEEFTGNDFTSIHDIDANLTMYVARHSWASIAHNVANVPLSVISKGMGHSNEKVTQIYLASFGNKDIDSANNNIINLI